MSPFHPDMTQPATTPALLPLLDDADLELLQGGGGHWGWGGCQPPMPPKCKPEPCAPPKPPEHCAPVHTSNHNGHRYHGGGSHLLGLLHLAALLRPC